MVGIKMVGTIGIRADDLFHWRLEGKEFDILGIKGYKRAAPAKKNMEKVVEDLGLTVKKVVVKED